MTFPVKTQFVITWTLTDNAGNSINNAAMVATLYAGRSTRDPDAFPGTPTSPIIGLSFSYVPSSAGLYSLPIPATLDPPLNGAGYVLVIDATVGATPVYHTEQPVVLDTAGASVDLTTVDAVKQRAEVTSTSDDNEIQGAITGFSRFILNRCGVSSLNSIMSLDETYDGNGNSRLFLRSYPIQNVTAVIMNGVSIPLSAGFGSWGIFVEASQKSIGMRGGIGNFSTFPYPSYLYGSPYYGNSRGPVFIRGQGNIEVQYSAGYNDTPEDLEYAVRCIVALNYKRKSWQDQASRGQMSAGASATTRFRDWTWPPEYENVIRFYQRKALV
jgi:hypothetical protein